jgi:hypothetical protein
VFSPGSIFHGSTVAFRFARRKRHWRETAAEGEKAGQTCVSAQRMTALYLGVMPRWRQNAAKAAWRGFGLLWARARQLVGGHRIPMDNGFR